MKLEQEAVTRERFQRLLSPAIAQQVIEGKVEVKKGGEVRDTTVLFSDIRGFTAMSESRRRPWSSTCSTSTSSGWSR